MPVQPGWVVCLPGNLAHGSKDKRSSAMHCVHSIDTLKFQGLSCLAGAASTDSLLPAMH